MNSGTSRCIPELLESDRGFPKVFSKRFTPLDTDNGRRARVRTLNPFLLNVPNGMDSRDGECEVSPDKVAFLNKVSVLYEPPLHLCVPRVIDRNFKVP